MSNQNESSKKFFDKIFYEEEDEQVESE